MRYFLVQDPYHEYAEQFISHIHRKYGYRAICFYSDRHRHLRELPAHPLLRSASVAATYEVNPSKLADFAAHLHNRCDIAAVVPFNEPTVSAAVELAERLQLGWSQSQAMRRFRDKYALKEHLRVTDPDLRVNATRSIKSLADISAVRNEAAFQRFVLKPNDGFGNRSIGLFDANTRETELSAYLRQTDASILMEEYVGGTEYFVNGQIDAQGTASIIAIFEYQRRPANGRHNIDFETRRVAHSDPLFAVLSSYAQRVLRATELLRSPFHLELKVDDRGPCLIEVAARLPGLGNAFLCGNLHAGKLDWFDVAAHYYLDSSDYGALNLDWQTYDSKAVRYVHGVADRSERIYRLRGIAEIEAMPEFDAWVKKPSLGTPVRCTVDSLSMPWNVVIKAADEAQLDGAAAQMRELLQWNRPPSNVLKLGAQIRHILQRCYWAARVRILAPLVPMSSNITIVGAAGVIEKPMINLRRVLRRPINMVIRRLQLAGFGKQPAESIRIAPEHEHAVRQAVQWAEEYLARPHPLLGRKGPICPFVKHTVDIGGYTVSVHDEINGGSINRLRGLVLRAAADFLQRSPNVGSKGAFASLVMVFPSIPGHRLEILDQLHSELKTALMERDLMLSPFHPNSTKPSISNPDFQVFRAPFPALVIRHMDVRDIAFLHANRRAFLRFRARYARLFDEGKVSDEFGYVRLYQEACARFGV